jgi:hypothetical protein
LSPHTIAGVVSDCIAKSERLEDMSHNALNRVKDFKATVIIPHLLSIAADIGIPESDPGPNSEQESTHSP